MHSIYPVFTALFTEAGASPSDTDHYWQHIQTAYTGPDRHYHTLGHLEALYSELTAVKDRIQNWQAVRFCLFFHDLVYDPLRKDNEEQSAQAAVQCMKSLRLPEETIDTCYQMIRATAGHDRNSNEDVNYFLDADLSVLGQPAPVYEAYRLAVRKEYAVYPDPLYAAGRAAVLRHFLQLPALFKTPHFAALYEAAARHNMQTELAVLTLS